MPARDQLQGRSGHFLRAPGRRRVSPAAIGYARGVGELLTLWTRASKLTRVATDQAMGRHGVRVGQNLVLEVLWDDDGLTPGELA